MSHIALEGLPSSSLPDTLILGPWMLRTEQNPLNTPNASHYARLGDEIQLRGYDLVVQKNLVSVTLYWEALATQSNDYTVFVHLSEGETLLAQADAPPCNGHCPTSLWQTGDTWRDTHLFVLPESYTGSDSVSLSVGMYNPLGGTRMTATDDQGQAIPNDSIPLCVFDQSLTICSPVN